MRKNTWKLPRTFGCPLAIVLVLGFLMGLSAQAQTFNVIHNFTAGRDGANPFSGLTIDSLGDLYGTAFNGADGFGAVYKLAPHGSGWVLNPLYSFTGGSNGDGAGPIAKLAIGANGTLYGSTIAGGQGGCSELGYSGCGTIFNLRPQPTVCRTALCPWMESVLYAFPGGNDGGTPFDDLTFDRSGNLYGGTLEAGCAGYGVVYELSPAQGPWTETVLYCADANQQGGDVHGGVTFDSAGNIYGVLTLGGQHGVGAVYELSPSGGGWIETTLYNFPNPDNDGGAPAGGLIIDSTGNLYGTTYLYGSGGGGTVFELSPSGSGWTYNVLYSFSGSRGSAARLTMDAAGNLYGTTDGDGAGGQGMVFELTHSNGAWMLHDLHDFTGGTDGGNPEFAGVVLDTTGNLYGTAAYGGTVSTPCPNGCGVVWEITPN